ncbi:hypothetical protein VARIO8X_110183 [Burkholderiales bacterium 8X]|nr:hypothetical protein VARIO8X_110183 [Burkholderiales bacterium 8X]
MTAPNPKTLGGFRQASSLPALPLRVAMRFEPRLSNTAPLQTMLDDAYARTEAAALSRRARLIAYYCEWQDERVVLAAIPAP